MSPPYDILVAGEINPDLILSGNVEPLFGQVEQVVDAATLSVGASSVIFACGAARLGLRVAFIGKCGDDLWGRFMQEEMQRCGIDTRAVIVVPRGTTGLSVILNRGTDRAILTYPGLIGALSADEIRDDLLRQARHLHVAAYFLQTALRPGLPDLFRRAHTLGLTTSLDPNYDPTGRWEGLEHVLPLTDVLLPNATEACALTRQSEVEAAAACLAGLVRVVAVKLGAAGALGRQGETRVYVPTLPVNVVDTIGAGDTFDAGFLYGYLHGWSLEESLRLGVVCGALSTRAAGGIAAQPTLEQALPHLRGAE